VPELFESIRELYSPFTLAALPIGTFEPQTMLKSLHMNPNEAVKAHLDLGSPTLSIGIHWGTFMTSNEPYLSPSQQLSDLFKGTTMESREREAVHESQFITTAFGETLFISS
jgi:N-acyl-phosphatidylethanolamine-hydrolysing phospholipase D